MRSIWREAKGAQITLFGEEYNVKKIERDGREGFEIDMTEMYDRDELPKMNLEFLEKLGEHFGTTAIDVDDISNGGCESCDYGSRYGWEIQVFEATKNLPEGL